jgi:hypothetical protein
LQPPLPRSISVRGKASEETIVPDDRSDSDAGVQKGSGRKARPPVIELTATDVTPEQAAQDRAEESAPKPEQPKAEAPRTASAPPPSSPPAAPRNPMLFAIIAGMIGLLTGALILAVIVLFASDGVKRLMASATETVSGSVAMKDFTSVRDRTDEIAKTQSEMQKRLADIETQMKALDPAALKMRVGGLESSLKDTRNFVEEAQTGSSVTGAALVERLTALEEQLKKMTPRPAAANAAEVVALGALQDAIASGKPFAKELGVVRSMLGEAAAPLAPFESSASAGLPTIAALRQRFSELAPKLVREPEAKGGYFSKLLSSASHLVEVRPFGEVAGTSAGAVTARIEVRLARDDLSAALDQAAQLPEPAKREAADWIASAKQRRDAGEAVKKLVDGALAASAQETPK